MTKLTRKHLAEAVHAALPLTKQQADNAVVLMLATIKRVLVTGGRVELRGFGSFRVRTAKGFVSNLTKKRFTDGHKAVFKQSEWFKRQLNREKGKA